MDIVEIKDPDGSVMRLSKYKGRFFGPYQTHNFEERTNELERLGFTNEDILISSYPKSGTNWILELTSMVLQKSANYTRDPMPLLDVNPAALLKQRYEKSEGARLFASHLPPNLLPQKIIENKVKIIHIYRNPKDVAVSCFCFIRKLKVFEDYKNAEWKYFLNHYLDGEVMYSDWYSYMKEWKDFHKENPAYPILWLNYEDMKIDLNQAMQKLIKFLHIDIDEQMISEIVQKCDFKAMHAHKSTNPSPILAKITDLKENIFYRKGEVGDWKNWFTVSQNEEFDRRLEPLLKALNLNFRYTL